MRGGLELRNYLLITAVVLILAPFSAIAVPSMTYQPHLREVPVSTGTIHIPFRDKGHVLRTATYYTLSPSGETGVMSVPSASGVSRNYECLCPMPKRIGALTMADGSDDLLVLCPYQLENYLRLINPTIGLLVQMTMRLPFVNFSPEILDPRLRPEREYLESIGVEGTPVSPAESVIARAREISYSNNLEETPFYEQNILAGYVTFRPSVRGKRGDIIVTRVDGRSQTIYGALEGSTVGHIGRVRIGNDLESLAFDESLTRGEFPWHERRCLLNPREMRIVCENFLLIDPRGVEKDFYEVDYLPNITKKDERARMERDRIYLKTNLTVEEVQQRSEDPNLYRFFWEEDNAAQDSGILHVRRYKGHAAGKYSAGYYNALQTIQDGDFVFERSDHGLVYANDLKKNEFFVVFVSPDDAELETMSKQGDQLIIHTEDETFTVNIRDWRYKRAH